MSLPAEPPEKILERRLCQRLVDLAHEMADDPWANCKDISGIQALVEKGKLRHPFEDIVLELRSLEADCFRLIVDMRKEGSAPLRLIEEAVNENTSQFVKDTHGEFAFREGCLETYDMGGLISLITFAPESCLGSKERYSALMVVQRFRSIMESGLRHPHYSDLSGSYGLIETSGFRVLAYLLNPSLGPYAMPEQHLGQKVLFPATQAADLALQAG